MTIEDLGQVPESGIPMMFEHLDPKESFPGPVQVEMRNGNILWADFIAKTSFYLGEYWLDLALDMETESDEFISIPVREINLLRYAKSCVKK